jgi:hypothetical protein
MGLEWLAMTNTLTYNIAALTATDKTVKLLALVYS